MTARSTARRVDWERAFEYYVGLGDLRTLAEVARHFEVRPATVVHQAKKRGWAERLDEIERKARAETDKRLVRSKALRDADTLRIIDAARARFASQLQRADFRMTGSDFVGLIKLEQLLEGEATERVELGEVRIIVEAVLGVARLFVDDVDGSVEERRGRFLAAVKELPLPGLERTPPRGDLRAA